MANKIVLKKSSVAGKAPLASDIDFGELALNYEEGKLYYKASDGSSFNYFQKSTENIVTLTTVSTTQQVLSSFPVSTYGSGEFLIQATQGTIRHITKILVVHNGTTADATEYGMIRTSTSLFNTEVDISGGNVRVLITPTSATSTAFKTSYTLIGV
jgi:hypothetical protein